ncbi:hypothetical protein [Pseudaminobacter sp. NGMCC 1.201702]|uniref:hypothetical protein n=1 Tax=Pseudaminobacter sp. NGMCC 1.201702 TaxID=3391825 RepID=UPI0039F1028E
MSSDIHRDWESVAIGVWENEGGAPGLGIVTHQYGRRVEADHSWTVYHVFSGVPASRSGNPMTGLSWSDATEGMLSLNFHNERPQRKHSKPPRHKVKDHLRAVDPS